MAVALSSRPTPTRVGTASASKRLAALRRRAEGDPLGVRDETWHWFREAGDRHGADREGALAELAALFASGRPATGVDGETEGMLVCWALNPVADRLIGGVTNRWLPWAGKRFDATRGTGDNVLVGSARWPAKLLWPLYSTRPYGKRLTAFDFSTRVEPGVLDRHLDVLVIDYASVPSNPLLVIKQIRDELVEVVPGAHLGKMIVEGPRGRHTLAAYFALRSSITA